MTESELEEPGIELSFPPKPEYVRVARHTVAALARMYNVSEDVVDDLKLAVSEACTNAISVNAAVEGTPPVHVVAAVDDGSLSIEVFDAGPGIDPALLDREADLDSEEFTFERGLSLPLIRGLVEDLEIGPREPRGSILRMRLTFTPGPEPPE